ncbi:MAG: acetyl-CoA carboxylase carboxyltransferase subunit alpha, partial [Gammaproteobacteria bacterium]
VQVARHPQRPHTLDFIDRIFDDFDELHGDRQFGDDASIIGGIAYLENMPVMIIGHEKGRDTEEKVRRNFGMPQPEGYRKAKRLMELAEQFSMPVITLIDTAGAYPGIEGEERGQSEAIARNLAVMSELKTPILVVVTGEGGSGGALAISVGDNIAMLQYATYSVASPEACASIIWRTAEKAPDAAEAMKVSAKELKNLKIIDEIIEEPLGGAHRDYDLISLRIKDSLIKNLSTLNNMSMEQLLDRRYKRLVEIGI